MHAALRERPDAFPLQNNHVDCPDELENAIKLGAAIISLAAILITAWQFLITQRVAASTPYLERKLAWCEEAVETAAALAVRLEPREEDVARFGELYWGVMGLIENRELEAAMVAFGEELESTQNFAGGAKDEVTHLVGLRGDSLRLARACRAELTSEWSVSWRRVHPGAPRDPEFVEAEATDESAAALDYDPKQPGRAISGSR